MTVTEYLGASWRRFVPFAIMAVAALALVACGGGDDDGDATGTPAGDGGTATSTATADGTGGAGVTDATVRIGVPGGTMTGNPNILIATGAAQNGHAMGVLEGLTNLDDAGNVIPQLATEWAPDADGLGMAWSLREGVTFHNGEPFTSADVVATWEAYLEESATPTYRTSFARIESVEAVGDYEVRTTFSEPFPELPRFFATLWAVLPDEYLAEVGSDGFSANPVGTGPYQIESAEYGGSWVLERFDDYWGELPPVKTIELVAISDAQARVAQLEAGDIDIAMTLDQDGVALLEGRDDIEVRGFPGITLHGFRFNQLHEPMQNRELRLAINHAIDRESVVALLGGEAAPGVLGCYNIGGVIPGCPTDVEPYPYDPERARDLLTEAGYPDGIDLEREVLLVDTPHARDAYAVVFQNLEDVGIRFTNVQWLDSAAKVERQTLKEYAAAELNANNLTYDGGYDLIRLHLCGSAQSSMCDEELDERIIEAASNPDADARDAAVADVYRDLYDDPPWAVVYHPGYAWAFRTESVSDWQWLQGHVVTLRNLAGIIPAE